MTSFLLLSRVFSGHVGMHGAHGLAQEVGLQALALSPKDTREDIYPPLIAFLFLLHGSHIPERPYRVKELLRESSDCQATLCPSEQCGGSRSKPCASP